MLITFALYLLMIIDFTIASPPEQGKFSKELTDGSNYVGFVKTLYKNSTIRLKVANANCDGNLEISWVLRSSSCYGEYEAIVAEVDPQGILGNIALSPEQRHDTGSGYYLQSKPEVVTCESESTVHVFEDYSPQLWIPYPEIVQTTTAPTTSPSRKRRDDDPEKSDPPTDDDKDQTPKKERTSKNEGDKDETPKENPISKNEKTDVKSSQNSIAMSPHTAPYILIVEVRADTGDKFSVVVNAEMETPLGYLSAHDYPLKTFYMIMCIVYSLYAVAWLIMSACNFRDLLRVQFWVGGVILLGMIEKAVFYSEYLTVNTTGVSVMGAVKFAEVVSALKRSLARMLVIIVSLGFGIVKPRLGPMLHRVIGIGILYFIIAIVEALVRNDASSHPGNNKEIFAAIPLAVIDSVICWWIFMSLMQTMKTLRLRRNVVKLSLYRHFSNTIIFCVIASLAMVMYSFRYRDACETAWREKWVDVAFWHVLFSIILLVIMILWRPNVNNQRYAFSALVDDDEDDVEEPMLHSGAGATETVKMRGLKNVSERRDDTEDSLKWIEENIPETIADAALPAIMDSDEEIVASKYEMSKME